MDTIVYITLLRVIQMLTFGLTGKMGVALHHMRVAIMMEISKDPTQVIFITIAAMFVLFV